MTELSMSSAAVESFRKALSAAKHPVALAGAGLSAASGIPTFRGAGGLWRQHDALSLATPEAFRADPSKVWQFYHYRRSVVLNDATRPNAAHFALAHLLHAHHKKGNSSDAIRSNLLQSAHSFHVITQNVDGLSHRALDEFAERYQQNAAPHQHIIEMHGNVLRTICTKCGHAQHNGDDPISSALEGTENLAQDYQAIPHSDLPRCQQTIEQQQICQGLLRPGVVWFGESIPDLSRIGRLIHECDLILVLGTSSTVYPAAGFAEQVKQNGGQVAVFNTDSQTFDSHEDGLTDWYFQGPVEQVLPNILGL